MLRRLWDNLGTLGLALLLAMLVWVVALNEENPVEEANLAQPVPIELIGKPDNMMVMGPVITRTSVTLRAPREVWARLGPQSVRVTADLSGLEPGQSRVPLTGALDEPTARLVRLNPDSIVITLENSGSRAVPLRLDQTGTPALGYTADTPMISTTVVTVSGPASAVASVSEVVGRYSVEGLRRDLNTLVTLVAVDSVGIEVGNVSLSPPAVRVAVPVTQKQGFRDVAVKVNYTGQVASGYQVTGVTVSPVIITVSSSDPRVVDQMPGFVETQALNISGASDDIVRRLPLQLPPGVIVEGDQTVLVQVSVAAIEYSVRVARSLEVRGLAPGYSVTLSPVTVDVLILGPLSVLDRLTLADVRVVVDVSGRDTGVYQVAPVVELLDDRLRAESVFPSQIEVIIEVATPTPTPFVETLGTPGVATQPSPTVAPTFTRTPPAPRGTPAP